jgi:hypothetical protein
MRPAIFVSLALASGLASFAASACDTRADYNNKISNLQSEYQAAVNQANNAYLEKTVYSVRSRGANLQDWNNSVNIAMVSYTRNVQEAYDNYMNNACLWWW